MTANKVASSRLDAIKARHRDELAALEETERNLAFFRRAREYILARDADETPIDDLYQFAHFALFECLHDSLCYNNHRALNLSEWSYDCDQQD